MNPNLNPSDVEVVQQLRSAHRRLRDEMRKIIVGQEAVLDQLLMAIFCRGHALLMGVPGLAKTLMVSTLAQALDLYPRGYLDGEPTVERLLETVERYEEDSMDDARIHRPIHCRIDVDEALPVTADRPRGEADPLTAQLEDRLKSLLAATAHLCHPWKE